MKKSELIEQLDTVQSHIEHYEKRLANTVMPDYYEVFGNKWKWERQKEVEKKCLAYWKRKLNRICFKLMYNL